MRETVQDKVEAQIPTPCTMRQEDESLLLSCGAVSNLDWTVPIAPKSSSYLEQVSPAHISERLPSLHFRCLPLEGRLPEYWTPHEYRMLAGGSNT